ncbi:MAG TPA: hypothetical protein PKC19_04860, partial [Roseiflexaceae bacterium]|nr:hypothetical protein [Roseiflexaceae bacterium]
LLGVLILLLAGGLVVAGSGLAVQHRILTLPPIQFGVGAVRFAAFTTNTPNCRTPGGTGVPVSLCVPQSAHSPQEYFAIWMYTRSQRGVVPIEYAERLFLMPIHE